MNDLELPEAITGRWRHALFLTYGFDLTFFERVLWRQFSAACRNKIVLADGQRFLSACEDWAHTGESRHLNQIYVGAGIFGAPSAHAKMILLTNPDEGRLIVGSGNLSMRGYASGGECFSQYDYNAKTQVHLPAFLSAVEMLQTLIEHGYVTSPYAVSRIRRLMDDSPWLFSASADGSSPVRHNLARPFLAQLIDVIADEVVEDAWLHAPFYDNDSFALAQMLQTLKPRRVHVLVQEHMTSVNVETLKHVCASTGGHIEISLIRRKVETDPYIHAKFYLFRLRDRAVLLHGSPNLSRTALLLSPPRGNVELANLLIDRRDAFDGFLDGLEHTPYRADILDLPVRAITPEETPEVLDPSGWRLTGGEWRAPHLVLRDRGQRPEFTDMEIILGPQPVPDISVRIRSLEIEITLPNSVHVLLHAPVPVQLRWREGGAVRVSNRIFACNIAALDHTLDAEDTGSVLEGVADLNLNDEDLERLLDELHASFPIDRDSIWQMSGRAQQGQLPADDSDAPTMAYSEIDFESLRRHPRLQQYFNHGSGETHGGRTRLQIVLNMILAHFRKVKEGGATATDLAHLTAQIEGIDIDSEEEREAEEEAAQARHWSAAARLNRHFVNFIKRFLTGLRDEEYRESVGYPVIALNWIIFHHIIWRLFFHDWMNKTFLVESLLAMWQMMWGEDAADKPGYLNTLNDKQRTYVLAQFKEYRVQAYMLAAIVHADSMVLQEHNDELRLALRNTLRHLLTRHGEAIQPSTIDDVRTLLGEFNPFQAPTPGDIVAQLDTLCRYDTAASFLRTLEQTYGYPDHSCHFALVTVNRDGVGGDRVHCLVCPTASALADLPSALATVARWMDFETRDYYRAVAPAPAQADVTIFFDASTASGYYFRKSTGATVAVSPQDLIADDAAWAHELTRLAAAAVELDANHSYPPALFLDHVKSTQK